MTSNVSDIKTYSIYRYNVPFDGTFTTETGTLETIDKPRHDPWAGPNDHDPIEHQH